MSKLRLLVVGPGLIGQKHINLIIKNNATMLVGIVAPDNELNIKIANKVGVNLYSNLADAIVIEKPNGVIISSPNEFHYDQAVICIEAGVAVLIEKPITEDYLSALQLVKISKEKKVSVLVGHHRAYSPLLKSAKELIRNNGLGRLVSVIGSAQFLKPMQYFKDGPWRTRFGGGPILINLIHEIGNLRTLVGEIDKVSAISSNAIRGFEVEDTVALNFVFTNGVLGTFLLSDVAASAKSWEQTSKENPSYPSYGDEDCYTIAGTKGSISIPSMKYKHYNDKVEPSWWTSFEESILIVEREDPLECQLNHFVDVIKGLADPLVSASEGYKNLLVIEAIRRSIASGCIVKVGDC